MNVGFWVRNPHLIVARTRYWWYTRRNPDAPWLCPGTIEYLQRYLTPDMTMLEFGSGRSTRWFARRVGRLVSVEHHAEWAAEVRRQLESDGATSVDYRVISLDHPEADPEPKAFEPMPRYVAVATEFADESLDAVLVDGHYRTHCVRAAAPRVRPGGVLVVDDTNLWQSGPGPFELLTSWQVVDDSTNGIKRSVIWQKPKA